MGVCLPLPTLTVLTGWHKPAPHNRCSQRRHESPSRASCALSRPFRNPACSSTTPYPRRLPENTLCFFLWQAPRPEHVDDFNSLAAHMLRAPRGWHGLKAGKRICPFGSDGGCGDPSHSVYQTEAQRRRRTNSKSACVSYSTLPVHCG